MAITSEEPCREMEIQVLDAEIKCQYTKNSKKEIDFSFKGNLSNGLIIGITSMVLTFLNAVMGLSMIASMQQNKDKFAS